MVQFASAARWQAPRAWGARNAVYSLFLVCFGLFGVAGIVFPDRRIVLFVFALLFLAMPVRVAFQFTRLTRRARREAKGEEGVAFAFYSCETHSESMHSVSMGEGWAVVSRDSLVVHPWGFGSSSREPVALGAPVDVDEWRPSRWYYDQLRVKTTLGEYSFQVIRESGSGFGLAGSRALNKLVVDIRDLLIHGS